jgi:NADH:ubiquinone oxidoreductase subunit 4 (subunit M)
MTAMDSLTPVLLTPVVTAVLLLLIPGNLRVVLRSVAILGSALTAWTAIGLFARFQPGQVGLQSSRSCPGSPWGP